MKSDPMEVGTQSATEIIKLDTVTAPTVTNKDLEEKFLLTLHRHHTHGDVDLMYWLDGIKSDNTRVKATAFQYVKVVDHKTGELITYVPPILIDPTGVIPADVVSQLGDIFYKSETLDKVIPGRGKAYLDKMIGDCINEKADEVTVWRKLWDDFFVRFGLEPIYNKDLTSEDLDDKPEDGEVVDVEYF